MAVTDPDPRVMAAMMGWPEPWQFWSGGEYPSRRPPFSAASGWECPGCHRCFSPSLRECPHCQPAAEAAPDWGNVGITPGAPMDAHDGVAVGLSRRLGPDDGMSDEDYER